MWRPFRWQEGGGGIIRGGPARGARRQANARARTHIEVAQVGAVGDKLKQRVCRRDVVALQVQLHEGGEMLDTIQVREVIIVEVEDPAEGRVAE